MNKVAFGRHRLAQVFEILESPLQDNVTLQMFELGDAPEDFAERWKSNIFNYRENLLFLF